MLSTATKNRHKDKVRPNGYVYVVADDLYSYVKIGQSVKPGRRIKSIECAMGVSLPFVWVSPECANYIEIERRLHDIFFQQRQRGEWFKVDFHRAVAEAERQNYEVREFPANWDDLVYRANQISLSGSTPRELQNITH